MVTYELRILLSVDNLRPVGYSLPMEQARQDNSLILSTLSRVIVGLFQELPPCLKGNVEGWAQFGYGVLEAFPGVQYDGVDASRFITQLGSLVAQHTDMARRIERPINDRPVPLMNSMDEELIRLMQINREEVETILDRHEFRQQVVRRYDYPLQSDGFNRQYEASWDAVRGEGVSVSPDLAEETAEDLFEATLPWAAEQLKRDDQIVLDTCPSRLKYVFWRGQYDQIRVFDGIDDNPVGSKAYRGWLCLVVNSPERVRVPQYDRLLQRLLLLQADEKKVWRIAYFHHNGGHVAVDLMHQMGGRSFSYRDQDVEWRPPRYDGPIQYEQMEPVRQEQVNGTHRSQRGG